MTHTEINCKEEGCERTFLSDTAALDHAQAVHTFNDIRSLVSEAVRAKFGRRGNYDVTPVISSIYTYVVDIAADWAVFEADGSGHDLWKVSFAITDNIVTLGDAVAVAKRTVYETLTSTEGVVLNLG